MPGGVPPSHQRLTDGDQGDKVARCDTIGLSASEPRSKESTMAPSKCSRPSNRALSSERDGQSSRPTAAVATALSVAVREGQPRGLRERKQRAAAPLPQLQERRQSHSRGGGRLPLVLSERPRRPRSQCRFHPRATLWPVARVPPPRYRFAPKPVASRACSRLLLPSRTRTGCRSRACDALACCASRVLWPPRGHARPESREIALSGGVARVPGRRLANR